ncbi:YueI family protein [Nicoliella lavandulae]|uniref:YueI family protein n=1 Tax=Nicoliella lavandulae TaxID=3082954 RepID=A0ABU8SKF4_9LACO
MPDNNSVNNRLEQSSYGTPKINPDEQRKYLGTFRERVSLAIMIKDLDSSQAQTAFQEDAKAHPDFQLIVNGQLDQSQTGPYIKIASQNNIKFTIRNDSFYFNQPDSYGVVFAAPTAINEGQIEVHQKYPQLFDQSSQPTEAKPQSFMDKLKHLFK